MLEDRAVRLPAITPIPEVTDGDILLVGRQGAVAANIDITDRDQPLAKPGSTAMPRGSSTLVARPAVVRSASDVSGAGQAAVPPGPTAWMNDDNLVGVARSTPPCLKGRRCVSIVISWTEALASLSASERSAASAHS